MAMPDPVELARCMAHIQVALDAVRMHGVEAVEIDGAHMTLDKAGDSEFASTCRNRAIVPGTRGIPDEGTAEAILGAFAARGIPHFFVWVCPCEDADGLCRGLVERGLLPVEHIGYPTLARSVERVPLPKIDGEVRMVDRADVSRWRPALDAVFGGSAERFERATGREGFDNFVVLNEGNPVAAAALVTHARLAYLYAGTVREDRRGRGYQRALIAARVNRAAERGCEWCASETVSHIPHSLDNLQRCGFRECFRKRVFECGTAGPAQGEDGPAARLV